jgi:pimeloyl-ACP methyl ester carboxylesterase
MEPVKRATLRGFESGRRFARFAGSELFERLALGLTPQALSFRRLRGLETNPGLNWAVAFDLGPETLDLFFLRRQIMHRLFISLLLFLLAPLAISAQDNTLVGHWEGAYSRLGAIQTVSVDFTIDQGKLSATYDLPDLSIFGEQVTDISFTSPQLVFKPKYGTFTMQLFADIGEMTGENKAWGPPVSLHLKRTEKPATVKYAQEEVRFRNGAVTLAGTLFKPATSAPYPVVVVVHGSGAQGREAGYYKFWGNFFASRGVAALIYDKRGVGQSSGNFESSTFDDLAGDVVEAVNLLAKRNDINKQKIGLMGISQGGWIVPLAASRTHAAKFLILYVGPSVTVEEQELNRVEYTMRAEEASAQDIADALAYTKLVFRTSYTGEGKAELDALTKSVRGKPWAEQVGLVDGQKDLDDWRRIKYDPAPVLKKTTIPVLSIFGEKDVLVPPAENLARMQSYLKEAGNTDVTIRVIPGVGHGMENFGTLKGGEWKWPDKFWIWPKKSLAFYETITGWLEAHGMR